MKRKIFVLLAMMVALSLISLAPASAKKPLVGDMELEFNLEFGVAGTDFAHITWVGTIDFDGDVYGMAFVPTGAKDVGKVHHFWEDWFIYPYDADNPFFTFENGVLTEFDPEDPVLWGTDKGVSSPNDKYRMNGSIDGAEDPFTEWVGRNVHMSGIIEWYPFGAPHYAPGVFHAH